MPVNVVDRLVAHKILNQTDGEISRYSEDDELAILVIGAFTRNGGTIRLVKKGTEPWEATAWTGKGMRQYTEFGKLASAACRAMLASIGISVKSSDG